MDKLMCVYNYVEMARVTGVPFSYLLTRGQQIKVVSQLLRMTKEQELVIPVYERQGGGGNEVEYEGATVIDPIRGWASQYSPLGKPFTLKTDAGFVPQVLRCADCHVGFRLAVPFDHDGAQPVLHHPAH